MHTMSIIPLQCLVTIHAHNANHTAAMPCKCVKVTDKCGGIVMAGVGRTVLWLLHGVGHEDKRGGRGQ